MIMNRGTPFQWLLPEPEPLLAKKGAAHKGQPRLPQTVAHG